MKTDNPNIRKYLDVNGKYNPLISEKIRENYKNKTVYKEKIIKIDKIIKKV